MNWSTVVVVGTACPRAERECEKEVKPWATAVTWCLEFNITTQGMPASKLAHNYWHVQGCCQSLHADDQLPASAACMVLPTLQLQPGRVVTQLLPWSLDCVVVLTPALKAGKCCLDGGCLDEGCCCSGNKLSLPSSDRFCLTH